MKFNEFLNHLSNYEPGKDIEVIAKEYGVKEVIKLASNENFWYAAKSHRVFKTKCKQSSSLP